MYIIIGTGLKLISFNTQLVIIHLNPSNVGHYPRCCSFDEVLLLFPFTLHVYSAVPANVHCILRKDTAVIEQKYNKSTRRKT